MCGWNTRYAALMRAEHFSFVAAWLLLNHTLVMKAGGMTSAVHPAGVWPAPSVVPPALVSGVSGRRITPSVPPVPAWRRVPSASWTTAKAPPFYSVVSVTGLQLFYKPSCTCRYASLFTQVFSSRPQMVPCIVPESPLRGRCGKSRGKWLQLHNVSNL